MIQTRFLVMAAATLPLMLSACELGPKSTRQMGYRGTGIDQISTTTPRLSQVPIPANAYPTPDDSGPRAGATYQNVQVLSGVSTERFNHLMAQMNNWVAPQTGDPAQVGCNYCHNPENMASDEKYTKVVARRMIQMTQNINSNWTPHVQQTGVTCWTCHRGNAVPNYRWAMAAPGGIPGTITGNKRGQNTPDPAVGYASLPYDPFSAYLKDDGVNNIRVAASTSHPTPAHTTSLKEAEKTYGLMMHLSKGLGVNCTYCHNSASFRAWNMSSPQRATAWYGLRMVAKTNAEYMTPLASVFPAVHAGALGNAERKGPMGDVYKINCATCHNGQRKPMNGVSMRADNPVLWPAVAIGATTAALVAPKADPNATAASCNTDFDKALAGKTIEFDTGAATIRSTSTPLLDSLVQIAGRCSVHKMAVEGHTDAVGNAAANMTLSKARAAAVDTYLTSKGVAATQLSATGFGSTKPVDTSGTPAGNQKNRRIEINVAG